MRNLIDPELLADFENLPVLVCMNDIRHYKRGLQELHQTVDDLTMDDLTHLHSNRQNPFDLMHDLKESIRSTENELITYLN